MLSKIAFWKNDNFVEETKVILETRDDRHVHFKVLWLYVSIVTYFFMYMPVWISKGGFKVHSLQYSKNVVGQWLHV